MDLTPKLMKIKNYISDSLTLKTLMPFQDGKVSLKKFNSLMEKLDKVDISAMLTHYKLTGLV
jgi:hypothetical protein